MDFFLFNIWPICILSVNFLTTLSYYVIYSKQSLKNKFFKLPVVLQKSYIGFFVLPLFISPFLPQNKIMENSVLLIITVIFISIIGLAFILMSFLKIGIIPSIKEKGGLSTKGVYGIVRHPIYGGTIISQIGLCIVNQSLISSIYILISIILYFIMTIIEEKDLQEIFGDEYLEYKKITKTRIIPFII
jgi:protein-S-isoprenylcysteine O-methyltransferase Ste14